ncbi:MAG: hypothetical protein JWN36_873 [Microbacteriaceae bacterium]|nr:hypothetical protein [Microbacteriaceae bacterium]
MVWWGGVDGPTMVEAGEYSGERVVAVSATQLAVPQSRANRVVEGWVELFQSGPTPIAELTFSSRTPARLFDSLRSQTQLTKLVLKWGDFADLSVLSGMRRLRQLDLGGAAAITTVEPLAELDGLRELNIDGSKRVTDYGPLRRLAALEKLSITESLNGPRQHADSLEFVRGLTSLRELLFTPRVDSLDYSPLLSLQHAELVCVPAVRGMVPSAVDLEWSVPGMGEAAAQRYAESQRTWTTAPRAEPETAPSFADELHAMRSMDDVWSRLLDGRLTRLAAIVRARDFGTSRRDLVDDGRRELDNLTGYPWSSPPDSIHLKLFAWLEEWRAAVRLFADDPEGEPRREAQRRVARLVGMRSDHARWTFD